MGEEKKKERKLYIARNKSAEESFRLSNHLCEKGLFPHKKNYILTMLSIIGQREE